MWMSVTCSYTSGLQEQYSWQRGFLRLSGFQLAASVAGSLLNCVFTLFDFLSEAFSGLVS